MTASQDSIWNNAELIAQLIALWEEGVPTAEMARRLTTDERPITKNTVIGKVRRLGLLERRVPKVKEVARRTPFTAFEESMPGTCMWPHGHPNDAEFRFCGSSPLVFGKSYCEHHAAVAYHRDVVKKRPPGQLSGPGGRHAIG